MLVYQRVHVSSQFLLAPDPSKSIREPPKKQNDILRVDQQNPDSGAKLPTIPIPVPVPIHSGFRVSP